jgi:hypothetical protein
MTVSGKAARRSPRISWRVHGEMTTTPAEKTGSARGEADGIQDIRRRVQRSMADQVRAAAEQATSRSVRAFPSETEPENTAAGRALHARGRSYRHERVRGSRRAACRGDAGANAGRRRGPLGHRRCESGPPGGGANRDGCPMSCVRCAASTAGIETTRLIRNPIGCKMAVLAERSPGGRRLCDRVRQTGQCAGDLRREGDRAPLDWDARRRTDPLRTCRTAHHLMPGARRGWGPPIEPCVSEGLSKGVRTGCTRGPR